MTAWLTQSAPKKFVSMIARASASVNSSIIPSESVPALLTTTSNRPAQSAAAATASNTEDRSVTSAGSSSKRPS